MDRIRRGLTLVEVLVAMAILAAVTLTMFMIYPTLFENVTLSSGNMRAFEMAKKEMEILKNMNFADLYNVSYNTTPVINPFGDVNFPNSTGVYYVQRVAYTSNGTEIPDLLEVEAVVCYRSGARVVGEDKNLNWALDAGEDINSDNKITSAIRLNTLIFNRNL